MIFDSNIFDPNIFDAGGVVSPPAVVATATTVAGSGKARKTDFWWELSTISFLARARRRARLTPQEPEVVEEKPAQVLPEPVEIVVDEGLEDEIKAVYFQANAEIASLQAQRAKDASRSEEFDRQIDSIKKELMRLREEEDILIIAMMD
jgi:hypothetical protein